MRFVKIFVSSLNATINIKSKLFLFQLKMPKQLLWRLSPASIYLFKVSGVVLVSLLLTLAVVLLSLLVTLNRLHTFFWCFCSYFEQVSAGGVELILGQCSISIPPDNNRKPLVFRVKNLHAIALGVAQCFE